MTTNALILMLVTWSIVAGFTVHFFIKVMRKQK